MNAEPTAFAAPAAPAPVTAPTLRDLYPNARIYSAEELKTMSPEQLTGVLGEVGKLREQASTEAVRIETQITALEQQIQSTCEAVRAEFGVDTVEQLDALIADTHAEIAAQYANLATLPLAAN